MVMGQGDAGIWLQGEAGVWRQGGLGYGWDRSSLECGGKWRAGLKYVAGCLEDLFRLGRSLIGNDLDRKGQGKVTSGTKYFPFFHLIHWRVVKVEDYGGRRADRLDSFCNYRLIDNGATSRGSRAS